MHRAIIAKKRPFALAIAGGGAEVIGVLTRHGGMSAVLHDATVLMGRSATDTYIGRPPDRYCSEWTARQLAMAAYQRVVAKPDSFGVGCTSSLASEGEREGRTHRVYLAVQSRAITWAASVELGAGRSREGEESLVARMIVKAIEYGQGLWTPPWETILDSDDRRSSRSRQADTALAALLHGESNRGPRTEHNRHVLCTSANPLHQGHLAMMRWVHDREYGQVDVELCLRNADKPPLDYIETGDRIDAVYDVARGESSFGELFLTSTPTFSEKARVMPGTTFLVGTDTLERIVDRRFGPFDSMLIRVAANDCRFLAFPRPGHDFDRTSLPPALSFVTDFADGFEPTDISSSRIRNGTDHAGATPGRLREATPRDLPLAEG